MTAPTAPSPGLGEREAVARGINPVAFACGPELYGLSADDHEWRLSFGYGAQQVALRRADAIIAEHIEPLRTENETLRAEREQSEKHRNDLMDSIVSLKTERGALRTRLAAVEAERDAAIARTEEAERLRETNRKLHRRMQIVEGPMASRMERGEREAAFWLEARKEAGRRASHALFRANRAEAEAARLTAKLAQAEGETATMRAAEADMQARAAKICDEAAAYFDRTDGHYDRSQAARSCRHSADSIRRLPFQRRALTNPEHPHGD